MMAFEGPFLAAIIARLPDEKYNLAAYGVAYSFALLAEAPVIMMMAASTALVKNAQSYYKLRNFNAIIVIGITILLALSLIPSFYRLIAIDLINLTEHVAHLTHIALIILLPWPGAIAYRRFLQGILIANNKTRFVSYGTVIRLLSMATAAILSFHFFHLPGAWVGAAALSTGVTMEMLMTHLMSRRLIKSIKNLEIETESYHIHYKGILIFYFPLVMAAFIGFGSHPLIAFFLGNSRMAIESLAVLPVINALVFIFRSLGLSYQEVVIALIGKRNEGLRSLQKFAFKLGLANLLILGIIAFSPFAHFWFIEVSGLSEVLSTIAILPTQILVIVPALSVLLSYQRAIQVVYKKTKTITLATFIEVSLITIVLSYSIYQLDFIGITASAIALLVGRLGSNTFLWFNNRKVLQNYVG